MRIVLMDFTDPIKLISNENRNTQIYKTIGSLTFYKYEQLHTICFKSTCVTEYNPYAFFSGTMNNNNNLSQLSSTSVSNEMCVTIDDKYCYDNQPYYNNLIMHMFVNNGTFYANDVCNLAEYIVTHPFNMILAYRLLSTIYLQYQLLVDSGYSISYIDPEDILVISSQGEGDDSREGEYEDESTMFFFSNYEKIYKIDTTMKREQSRTEGVNSNDSIRVVNFYDHDNFVLPPELIENMEIPFICHKSSWFYSLACTVLYCLNPSKTNDLGLAIDSSCNGSDGSDSSTSKHESMINQLSEYNGTKLYYTLLYCLTKEPCKREFILF